MKRILVLALLFLSGGHTNAIAGIDLTWNTCNTGAGAASHIVFDCADAGVPARLIGNFQTGETLPGFVTLEAVLDVRAGGASLPAMWHMEPGGCNANAFVIRDERPGDCPAVYPTWGSTGGSAEAFVTAYEAGFGGANRARVLIAVTRNSSDAITLVPGNNYMGFDLTIAPADAEENGCTGCAEPAEIQWSAATLHTVAPGYVARTLQGSGLTSDRVTANGGGGAMRIFATSPFSVRNDSLRTFSVRGYGILPGAAARLVRVGEADIPGLSVVVSADGTTLTAEFDLRTRPAGLWGVVVTNPGGDSDALSDVIELVETFRIVSIEPDRALNSSWIPVTVHGFGMLPGATLTIQASGGQSPGVYSPVVSADGRTLTANLNLEGAAAGAYDVIVSQAGSAPARLPFAFLVLSGTFRAFAVSPAHGTDTGPVTVTVLGEGMDPAMTARLTRTGETPIPGTGVVVAADGASASVTFDLTGRPRGAWTVELENPEGIRATLVQAFAIHEPRGVTSILPAIGGNTTSVPVTVHGSGFEASMEVILELGASRIVGLGTTVAPDGRSLATTFDLHDRAPGGHDVVVQFLDGEEIRLAGAFQVVEGIRVLTIAPVSGRDTTMLTASVGGTGFHTGADVRLRGADMPDIAGTSVVVAPDGHSLNAVLDLRGQARGPRNVVVTNPDGVFASLPAAFEVLPVPRADSVSPAWGFDTGVTEIEVTGANFAPGASMHLVRGVQAIAGTEVVLIGSTAVRARFLLLGRSVGTWSVRVTNPGGVPSVLTDAFEIRSVLSLAAVRPDSAADAGPVTLSIDGHGIAPGATAALRRDGQTDVPGTSVIVAPDSASLTATFDVTGRRAGAWDVVVSTPDAQTATLPAGFTILGAPQAVTVTPGSGGDAGPVTLTIAGGNFTNSTVRLERPGAQFPASVIQIAADGASLTATADLTDQPVGAWDIVVTNPGGFAAVLAQAFEVLPVFRLLGVSPSSAEPAYVVPLVVSGRWIEPGATVRLSQAGGQEIIGQSVVVSADGRTLSAQVDLIGAAFGDWNVTVTQPGGATAMLPNGFSILMPVAHGGLDLSWNTCNSSPSRASEVTFQCTEPVFARLFGNFQAGQPMPGFVALEAVLDVRVEAAEIPPFWRFEDGGCNATGISITDARDVAVCASASNATPWGSVGQAADAFITGYGPGTGGPNRGRLLVAVARPSSSPFAIEAGRNYFGFEIDVFMDNAVEFGGTCDGCAAPAEIVWSSGTLHSSESGGQTEVITRPGVHSNRVTVNGGGRGMGIFAVSPGGGRNDAIRPFTIYGYGIQAGGVPQAKLVRAGESDIAGQVTGVAEGGVALTAQFDLRERAAGRWGVVVTNSLGIADSLADAVEVVESFRLVSIDPSRGAKDTWLTATVHGFGILPGATVAFGRDGAVGPSGYSPQVSADGRTLTANFDLAQPAVGFWDVVVRQPDGEAATLPDAFVVLANAFRLLGISPVRGVDTSVVRATLSGEQMLAGLTARLTRSGQPPIVGTDIAVAPDGFSARVTFDLRGRALGAWTVAVTNGDNLAASLGNGFSIVPVRGITEIVPALAGNTGPVRVTIGGTNFVDGVIPALSGPGLPRIEGTGTEVLAGGVGLTTTFEIDGRPLGHYDVGVTFPDQDQVILPGGFEIRQGIAVRSVRPNFGPDTAIVAVTIFGTSFETGAIARLSKIGEPVIPGTATVVGPGGDSLVTSFDLRGRAPGRWNVTVENPDGVFAGLDAAFEVGPVPRPTAVTPASGFDNAARVITITGSSFAYGAGVRLVRGAESIAGTSTVVLGPTAVRTTIDLLGRTPGAWDVEVSNPSGLRGTLPGGFTVVPIVQLTSVTPASAPDAAPVTLTVAGRNFDPGIATWLRRTGLADIPGTSPNVAPDGRGLTAVFDITGRTAGEWDLVARNPDATADTLPRAFTLLGIPRAQTVTPAAAADFGTTTITVAGSNFAAGAIARLERAGSPPIAADSVLVAPDGAWVTARFVLTDQPVGLWDVIVTNPGGWSATLAQAFEIRPQFRLVSVSPNRSMPDVLLALTVTGRWIESGATARLALAGQADRPGQSIEVAPDGRSLVGTFDLAGAIPGSWDVRVTNPDGGTATLPAAFTVTTSVPESPLTLLWSACNQANPPGQEDLTFACDNPEFRARLFGNFRAPSPARNVVAISGGLDIMVSGSSLPPFWHFESGGCNGNLWSIQDDRDEAVCPPGTNATAYGSVGQFTDAFVTAYAPGYQGPNRARLLWAVIRASSNPVDIVEGTNYFAFEMGFTLGDVSGCAGCEMGASIGWSWALFESPFAEGGGEGVVLQLLGDGRYPSVASVNGGAGGVVPVRLSRFEAEARDDGIEVTWEFSAAGEYASVTVERREPGRGWEIVAAAVPAGAGTMSVLDHEAMPGRSYEYRLIATRVLGGQQTFGPVAAGRPAAGVESGIVSIVPNPVSGPATIEYSLPREGRVRLEVVDVQGRVLAPLAGGTRPAGRHTAVWDGRVDGVRVAAGVYFVRCEIEGVESIRRVTVVR